MAKEKKAKGQQGPNSRLRFTSLRPSASSQVSMRQSSKSGAMKRTVDEMLSPSSTTFTVTKSAKDGKITWVRRTKEKEALQPLDTEEVEKRRTEYFESLNSPVKQRSGFGVGTKKEDCGVMRGVSKNDRKLFEEYANELKRSVPRHKSWYGVSTKDANG